VLLWHPNSDGLLIWRESWRPRPSG